MAIGELKAESRKPEPNFVRLDQENPSERSSLGAENLWVFSRFSRNFLWNFEELNRKIDKWVK